MDAWNGAAYVSLGAPDAPRFRASLMPMKVVFAFPPGAKLAPSVRPGWAKIPQEVESGAISWQEASAAAAGGDGDKGMTSAMAGAVRGAFGGRIQRGGRGGAARRAAGSQRTASQGSAASQQASKCSWAQGWGREIWW